MLVDGHYELFLHTPLGEQKGTMVLESDGDVLSGTLTNPHGASEFSGGTVDGERVEFDTRIPTPIGRLKAHVTGKVEGQRFTGDAKLPLGTARLEGDKVARFRTGVCP